MTLVVFVYGTLKRGFPNHGHLAGQRLIAAARTVEAYPMIIQGPGFSPVMIPERGSGHRVLGELWGVDTETLARLDELESIGKPLGYIRERVDTVRLDTGATVAADVYFKPRDRISIVHSEPMADYQDRRYIPAEDRD